MYLAFLKRPLYRFRSKSKVCGDMTLQKHESYPDDNFKKLWEWSRVLHNEWKKRYKNYVGFLSFEVLQIKTEKSMKKSSFSPFID